MAGVANSSGNNPINLSVIIIAMNEGECMQFHKMHYKLYGNASWRFTMPTQCVWFTNANSVVKDVIVSFPFCKQNIRVR